MAGRYRSSDRNHGLPRMGRVGDWAHAPAWEAQTARGLPRRDLWLLPLIALLTMLALSAAAEVGARMGWPEQKFNSCKIPDRALGYRFKPNCTSVMKAAEGPWFTNTYNSCGYRSPQSCRAAPAGTRRIALIRILNVRRLSSGPPTPIPLPHGWHRICPRDAARPWKCKISAGWAISQATSCCDASKKR